MSSFASMTSEELAYEIAKGNQRAFFDLSARFSAMIHKILSTCSVEIFDKDDVYQEGLIGLYKAAITYDKSRGASFSTYAYFCIKHNIYSSFRVYFSKKNKPVCTLSSFDEVPEEQCPDVCTEPERLLIEKENLRLIRKSIDSSLSDYERKVFKLFLKGLSYEAIAEQFSTSSKSVDNAIQRIRGKLKQFVK